MTDYELYHHGVLGMKWGVRRYQNKDGSYIKRGLARYNRSQTEYDEAKNNLKSIKSGKKSGDIKSAKAQMKIARRKLNKDYDRLSNDWRADQGKALYQKGKTITDNTKKNAIAETAVLVGANLTAAYLANSGNLKLASISGSTIALGGSVVNGMLALKTNSENKKLRAYYGH